LSDLQQGDVPDIGLVEDSAIFLTRLEIGMSSISVEFVPSGNERLEGAGKTVCYGHYFRKYSN
jgi:hypothetical protein